MVSICPEKRAQRLTFWVRRPRGGGGGLPREGVVAKKFVLPLESFVFLGFRREESGMSREFCRDVPDTWVCSFKKFVLKTGWPRFGSVRLRFGDGTVRAVPVFGSGGSSKEGGFCVFQYSLTERTVPVPVSVPGKRFRRFRFRVRFLGKRFRRFRFPVPVRFLGHPVKRFVRVFQFPI